MFQLIVSVIAIALVAILAAASIYYGGSAFNSSTVKGNVAALINGGQQIAGANSLYNIDNSTYATQIIDLTASGVYLAASPTAPKFASGDWTLSGGGTAPSTTASVALKTPTQIAVCNEVVAQGGSNDVVGATIVAAAGKQFGCVGGAFVYKL